MNPAFLLGTAFNIAYWHRKYHSGTICKGVSNPLTSKALSGCEREDIPKWVWRKYRLWIWMKEKKSLIKMKGKNGTLLFVFNLKGLLEEWKECRNPVRIQAYWDRELEWNQRNLFGKWKGKMGFYYLYLTSKDY